MSVNTSQRPEITIYNSLWAPTREVPLQDVYQFSVVSRIAVSSQLGRVVGGDCLNRDFQDWGTGTHKGCPYKMSIVFYNSPYIKKLGSGKFKGKCDARFRKIAIGHIRAFQKACGKD